MSSFDENELNEFSAKFARELFGSHEWLRQYAKIDSTRFSKNILVVEVPAPVLSRAAYPLVIETDGDEVTVAFDKQHCHFDWPSFDHEHLNALKFLDDILQERIAVVSLWAGDRWVLSTTADTPVNIEPLIRREQADMAKIRSWKGKFSADLAIDKHP